MLALGLVLLLQQAPEAPLFTLQQPAAASGAAAVTLAADRAAVGCSHALRQLGAAMNWNVAFESQPLEAELRFASVDLNFSGQTAQTAAQLIAAAGGADIVFDPGDAAVPMRPTLHVVRPPDAATAAGRQRLRLLAAQWYRSFLLDELRNEPLVQDEAMRVRMNLGRLLVDSGDLEAAITFFAQVCDDAGNALVPAAMLRVAQCQLDLAAAERDAAAQQQLYGKAEQWARQLLDRFPSDKAANAATVVLGKALLGQQRCDECRAELNARSLRLLGASELLDVGLLIGEAAMQLQAPERVYEQMLAMRQLPGWADMTDAQFLDYHFLLGYGALGCDKPELAMQALEWFLVRGPADRRRGLAHVLLGESYLRQQRYLEARAAAALVRQRYLPELDEASRRRAIELYASSGLKLGDRDEAFRDLELLVLRQDDPQLALYLVDALIADRQYQWAISVIARTLEARDDAFGDQGRCRRIQAMFAQCEAAQNFADFPEPATTLALKIRSPQLRSTCAELLGQAYERLGKPEHAADAYRGILR